MRWLRTLTATGWLALVCLALTLIVLTWCASSVRRDAADVLRRTEADKTLAEGRTAAAQDAGVIRDKADARNRRIDVIIEETDHEIRNAPDDPAASAAALRGLCRLYPDRDPRCRLFDADPGGLE